MRLPAGWSVTKMGQIGRYLNGRAFKQSEWSNTGRPILRIQNLTGTNSTFNYFDGELNERYIVRKGDLLFSWAATLGVYVWNGPEAALNQHIFKVESHIDPTFHRYLLEEKIDELYAKSHGSGMVHVTKGEFDEMPVLLPPLDEQRRIAATLEHHLSRLDKALDELKGAKSRLVSIRHSMLQSLVSGEKSFGADKWIETTLGEVAKWSSGGTPTSSNPTFYGGAIPWCVIGDLTESTVSRTAQSITELGLARSSAKIVEPGTVLLAMYGASIGRTGIAAKALATNQAIACADVNRNRIEAEYLLMFLQSQKRLFAAAGKGGAQPNISQGVIKTWEIRLPALDEQRRIVAMLAEFDNRTAAAVHSLNLALAKAATMRRSILNSAFNGTLAQQGAIV